MTAVERSLVVSHEDTKKKKKLEAGDLEPAGDSPAVSPPHQTAGEEPYPGPGAALATRAGITRLRPARLAS